MPTIDEIQPILQNLTKGKITQSDIAQALGTGRANISLRIKNRSLLTVEELKKLGNYFNINLLMNIPIKQMSNNIPLKETPEDCIELEHIHIKPSCGSGTVILDEPDVTPIKLGKKLIETVLRVSDVNNLKTFTASGDSMIDTIDDGNLLLVDIGRTDFNNGGVFVLTINNEWYVKRLRKRLSGELDVISDNKDKYPIETYTQNDDVEIVVKGMVIKNLSKGL